MDKSIYFVMMIIGVMSAGNIETFNQDNKS